MSGSGLVAALRGLHSSRQGAEADPLDSGHKLETAIQLVTALFDVLPLPHELAAALANEYSRVKNAEGDTPAARRLQRAYMEVESILTSCRSHDLSRDALAVDLAESVLGAASIDHHCGENVLIVTRGDAVDPNLLGATISSVFSNGTRFELTLRRVNYDYDSHPDRHPEGHWVLEGFAVSPRGTQDPYLLVDLYVGPRLPDNIGRMVGACLQRFTRACSRSVMRLVVSNEG